NIASKLNIHHASVSKLIKKAISKINHLQRDQLYGKLGDNLLETIVEVDETHIVSRRDGEGRILRGEQIWVIGAICRTTKIFVIKMSKEEIKTSAEDLQ
ncbi:hypothetical protein COBT_002812, partial [Conglomerata obtusa]